MMLRLFNKWFGWDYVAVAWSTTYSVRRVKTMPNGERYIVVWGDILFFDEKNPGKVRGSYSSYVYVPLTFKEV